MKLIILCCILLWTSLLWAQSGNPARMNASMSWHGFSAFSNLTYFENKSLAMGYEWNAKNALRIRHVRRQFPFTLQSAYALPYPKKTFGHAGVEYIRTAKVKQNVHFYIGGGPALHIAKKYDNKEHNKLFDKYTYGPAISWVTGLNYFLSRRLSILAEYSMIYQFGMNVYSWYEYRSDDYKDIAFYRNKTTFVDSFSHIGFSFHF